VGELVGVVGEVGEDGPPLLGPGGEGVAGVADLVVALPEYAGAGADGGCGLA
jgi:hypothetical protein